MASQQQTRKKSSSTGQEAEGGQAQGHGSHGQQQGTQAMNLEEIGKYRAEAQQRSVDAIRAAEERFNKANQQQGRSAHGAVAVGQAPGGAHGAAHASGTKAQQWLADAASDGRERCNRAMGMGTNPTAAHRGLEKEAASRGMETKKSSAEQEGEEGRRHLTRQGEMGHGRDAQKTSHDAEAARFAVEKHDRTKEAGATAGQQQQSATVGSTAEHGAAKGAEAKDAGARGAAQKTKEATQQTKETAAKAKDATTSVAGTTVDYAKQAAAKTKDVTLAAGGTAAEYARTAAEKAKEAAVATAKTTAGYTQQAAVKAKDVTVSTGAQVAQKAKEVTADAAHRVAEYAREKAEQGKEAAARAADQAEEPGSDATEARARDDSAADKAREVAGRRQHDDTSGDYVGHRQQEGGGTAEQAKDRVKDATGSVAQKASDTAGSVKDTAKEAAGGVEQRLRETAAQAKDKVGDAEHKAGEVKQKASSETDTGGGVAARAKSAGDVEQEGTTIVGDVLEAVGAAVVGLAQHTKGIVAGEEEVVPGDVVEGAEARATAGAKEEKRKTA